LENGPELIAAGMHLGEPLHGAMPELCLAFAYSGAVFKPF
jgi:hypothetical protein